MAVRDTARRRQRRAQYVGGAHGLSEGPGAYVAKPAGATAQIVARRGGYVGGAHAVGVMFIDPYAVSAATPPSFGIPPGGGVGTALGIDGIALGVDGIALGVL